MKFSHLATLVAVAESGGIRAAARRLGISQPAVSRTLKDMEIDARVALVVRGARGVTLTPSGQTIYERASVMVEQMRRLQQDLDHLHGTGTSQVSFTLSSALAMTVLPEIVSRFRSRMPNTELHIDDGKVSSSLSLLRNGTVDFIIGRAEHLALGHEYVATPIVRAETKILCRRGHPLMDARELVDLADARWVVPADSPVASSWLETILATHGLPKPNVVVSCQSAGVGLPLVCSGDFLTIAAAPILQLEGIARKLVAIPLAHRLPDAVYSMIVRGDSVPTPAVALLKKLLHRSFPEWGWLKYGSTSGSLKSPASR